MPINIAVVGGGMGGLAAAAALAQQGHSVTVYERSSTGSEVGFAFRVTSNSDRCLKHLGIDAVAGGAVEANRGRLLSADGRILAEIGENLDPAKKKKGVSVFASRPQVAKQLLEACQQRGVKIITGAKVVSVDIEKTDMTLQDGTTVSADLIVGADGIRSGLRGHIVDPTVYSAKATAGRNAFRFMLPASLIKDDKLLSQVIQDDVRFISWKLGNKQILVYPVDYNKQFSIVCTHPQELSDGIISQQSGDSEKIANYNQSVPLENVLSIYSDMEPRTLRLFKLADPNAFRIWKLQDLEEIPRWSANNTVIIGDAAHAVLPFGFSGASMAIEDATVLAELLPANVDKADIPARLQLLEQIRKPRVAKVRENSRIIADGIEDQAFIQQYMGFLSAYDAVEAGKTALQDAVKK